MNRHVTRGASVAASQELPVRGAPVWGPGMSAQQLRGLAIEQFGVLSSAQAHAGAMTERQISRRVASGQWIRVHRGVYQTQPGCTDWSATALAGLLVAGRGAALTHASAAHLHGLGAPPRVIEIGVPAERRVSPRPGLILRRIGELDERTDVFAWPWRTTVEHTVIDLAATLDLEDAVALAARAAQRRLTTASALRATLLARPHHRWRRQLGEALAVVADGAESAMEVRFVRDVVRPHGLPMPVLQHATGGARGWRSDAGFTDYRVLVELDGRLGHEGWGRIGDARRDRVTAADGWLTVRAGWLDVAHTPCGLALEVGQILAARGWDGRLHPCRRPECDCRTAQRRQSHRRGGFVSDQRGIGAD